MARQCAHLFSVLAAALGMRFEQYAITFMSALYKGLVITVQVRLWWHCQGLSKPLCDDNTALSNCRCDSPYSTVLDKGGLPGVSGAGCVRGV